MLVVELFSRHAESYTISTEEKTAKIIASIIVNDHVAKVGMPAHVSIRDGGGTQDRCMRDARLCSNALRYHEVYKLLITHKLVTCLFFYRTPEY